MVLQSTLRKIENLDISEAKFTELSGYFKELSNLKSIILPNSVTLIGGSAFSGCSGLTSITIPNSVTVMYGYTFSDCPGLLEIKCEAINPPIVGGGDIPNHSCKLKVPAGSVDLYKSANSWKKFGKIEAI